MRITFLIVLLACSITEASAQQKKYTIVFLHKKNDAEKLSDEASNKIMEGHMANINRLAKEGKLVAAGPFEGGGGIFILNTTSIEEANGWLSSDPGVQAKRWDIELLPYIPKIGSVCKVNEPYEMTQYSFIRFDAIVSKFTAPTFPQIIKKHNDYIAELAATGNVVTSAVFSDTDGGVLIMRGDVTKDVFESDPGVQEGLMELVIKKLYIAKGSFCEK
jgi:uncharacterized protein YciI